MKSSEIVENLQLNLRDLARLKSGLYSLTNDELDITTKIVEELCPRKTCELFMFLNYFNDSPKLPEKDITLNQLMTIFTEQGDLIDDLISKAKSDTSLMFSHRTDLNLKSQDVVEILIKQMMDNANEATWEIELCKFIGKMNL